MTDARTDAEMSALLRYSFQQAPLRFLRRITLRWLKGVFKTFPKGSYRYIATAQGETTKDSDIHITGKAPFQPSVEEQRPVIIYNRMATAGNFVGYGSGSHVQASRLSNNYQQKTSLYAGALVINCCSRIPDEAEHLAWVVNFWLMECQSLITGLGFHHLSEPVVGETSPAPDALIATTETEWTFCPVSMQFTFQYSWESTPERDAQVECIQVDMVDEVNQIIQSFIAEKGAS